MTFVGGCDERRLPLVVRPVQVTPGLDELLRHLEVTQFTRDEQRRLLTLVRFVDERARLYENVRDGRVAFERGSVERSAAETVGSIEFSTIRHEQLDNVGEPPPRGHIEQIVALSVRRVNVGSIRDEDFTDVLVTIGNGELQGCLSVVVEIDIQLRSQEFADQFFVVFEDRVVELSDFASLGTFLVEGQRTAV